MKIPYSQQFTPEQTPLKRLIPILRRNAGDPKRLRAAIAAAFFKDKADPSKLAGNTIIALKANGVINGKFNLTAFGHELLDSQGNEDRGHRLVATHILLEMGCVAVVETIREMTRAGIEIDLKSLPHELRARGVTVSSNSSDLSGVLNWLRAANVLDGYRIVEDTYQAIVGASTSTLGALAGLEEGFGGKPAVIGPTERFEKEVGEPSLSALYKTTGYSEVRKIRALALLDIVNDIDQSTDQNKRVKALELLAIRLCQMLDLKFLGWRETDVEVDRGDEVDALLHSARLMYSRWQIQCKVGKIAIDAVATEVGMQRVSLANVILLVGTERATDAAQSYRRKIVSSTNLNIILLDGPLLQRVIADPSELTGILRSQANDALRCKPAPLGIRSTLPSGSPIGSPTAT
jgi:hypothetical protein